MATAAMALVALVACLLAFLLVTRRVPLQDLGIKAHFDGPAVLGMVVAMVPLALMASALQMLMATYARSFKEAQTYLQLFQLLPTLPGMLLAISPVQSQLWMFAVPVLGQQMLVGEVMRGEVLGPVPFLLSMLSCGVLTAGCLALTTRMLREERIIFGRS
jgi:sodium transport system permease protein